MTNVLKCAILRYTKRKEGERMIKYYFDLEDDDEKVVGIPLCEELVKLANKYGIDLIVSYKKLEKPISKDIGL